MAKLPLYIVATSSIHERAGEPWRGLTLHELIESVLLTDGSCGEDVRRVVHMYSVPCWHDTLLTTAFTWACMETLALHTIWWIC